jgi:ABC-type uncharacterized transport system ATPase subunit
MTAPLVVTGAAKTFGAVKALAGASFDVRRGELLGLLGLRGESVNATERLFPPNALLQFLHSLHVKLL